jgi:hypothetical protein
MTLGTPFGRSLDSAGNRLAVALGISLVLHLSLFATWELRGHLVPARFLPRWLQALFTPRPKPELAARSAKSQATREVPLLFVEVDPAVATAEPPKDAPYYSSMSSRAANPDASVESNTPKIDGQQDKIVKTFDTLRPQPVPAPSPPVPEIKEPSSRPKFAEVQPKPKGSQALGDLAFAKPQAQVRAADEGAAEPKEAREAARLPPRTLTAAKMQKGIQAGEKVKMQGGVKRIGVASLDVKGTVFGVYDAALVAAVQERWDDLLEEKKFAGDRRGKVVLTFRLNSDGRVSDLKLLETNVGDLYALYCQLAITDPSPYEPWPTDMRRMVGATYRELRFTFYY